MRSLNLFFVGLIEQFMCERCTSLQEDQLWIEILNRLDEMDGGLTIVVASNENSKNMSVYFFYFYWTHSFIYFTTSHNSSNDGNTDV